SEGSAQVAGVEAVGEQLVQAELLLRALWRGEEDRDVAVGELGEGLQAHAARGRRARGGSNHRGGADPPRPPGDRLADRIALGAEADGIRAVLDVAAGVDAAVVAEDRGADLE